MNKYIFSLFVTALTGTIDIIAKNNEINLSVAAIPKELFADADVVTRYDSTILTLEALDKVQYNRKYAVTILNDKGKAFADLTESYNNFYQIHRINGRVYNAEGNLIRTLKEKDIYDRSTYGLTFAFHSDSRYKTYSFNQSSYPYTVVYEVYSSFKTALFLPDWCPQPNPKCAVEKAFLSVTYPDKAIIKHKEYLMPEQLLKTTISPPKKTTVTWELEQIKAYLFQPYSRSFNFSGPSVVLASESFQLLQYQGSMASWNELGAFNYRLNEGRDELPALQQRMVQKLIGNETDTLKIVQQLYAHMQQNTRYVANLYGIAGWQTFDATSVAKNGYGDCKGLTNYLKAMLKVAGIPSYTALVYAGKDYYKLDEAFPTNRFNHVILCVPTTKDSIWVECTSQQLPAGYLGSFTEDRVVLLTTETGGYLCRTPSYSKDRNFIKRHINLSLDLSNPQQKVTIHNQYSGLMQDDLHYFLKTQPEHKIRERVNNKFPFPSYQIADYSYQQSNTLPVPILDEHAEALVSGITSATAKRTFIYLGWMDNPMSDLIQSGPRTQPVVINESFLISDSIQLLLPEGYSLEAIPQTIHKTYPFATYSVTCIIDKEQQRLVLLRQYEQNKGVYEPSVFHNYQELHNLINAGKDNLNLVLRPTAP